MMHGVYRPCKAKPRHRKRHRWMACRCQRLALEARLLQSVPRHLLPCLGCNWPEHMLRLAVSARGHLPACVPNANATSSPGGLQIGSTAGWVQCPHSGRASGATGLMLRHLLSETQHTCVVTAGDTHAIPWVPAARGLCTSEAVPSIELLKHVKSPSVASIGDVRDVAAFREDSLNRACLDMWSWAVSCVHSGTGPVCLTAKMS